MWNPKSDVTVCYIYIKIYEVFLSKFKDDCMYAGNLRT